MKFFAWLVAGILLAAPAAGQDAASFYKGKTVRVIVGFTPGGGYDVYARLLARYYGRYIPGNPSIVVQNMPGAASLKAVQYVQTAGPTDGTVITTFNPGLITQSLTTPDKMPLKFLDYAWIGNIGEDARICFTWNATGIRSWQDFLARSKVTFGNTGVGTAAYLDDRILTELFGVKMHAVMGYPGSADKRLAVERGELDGDCGSWTSVPDDWLSEKKITLLLRFSKNLVAGMPRDLPYAGDLLTDAKNKQVFNLLTASALIGRPYIASRAMPADRLAALRQAFDATMKDPDFIADANKQRLLVTPMSGVEVEAAIKDLYQTPADIIAAARRISGD